MNVAYIAGIVASLMVFMFVIEMLRRGILRERFAALWLLVSLALLVLAIFPNILETVAGWLGIQVPANLLFTLAALTLLLVSVQLSNEIGQLERKTRRLAEEVALLRHDLEISQRGEKQSPIDRTPTSAGDLDE
jgi:hypothetical protein